MVHRTMGLSYNPTAAVLGNGRNAAVNVNGTMMKLKEPPRRRGFGLFDLSDTEDEIERRPSSSSSSSIRFTGNKSGFDCMGRGKIIEEYPSSPPAVTTTTPKSSRTSRLTTPARRSSHRSTPYSTTTSRALQRARKGRDEEEELIVNIYDTGDVLPKNSKYTMVGARLLVSDDEDEQNIEEDNSADEELPAMPSRNIFSRTHTPVGAASIMSPPSSASTPGSEKKTWGQWLKDILPLPGSVRKPLLSSSPEPEEESSRIKSLTIRSAKQEMMAEDDDEYDLPGSFAKSRRAETPEYHDQEREYVVDDYLHSDNVHSTPSRRSNGLFTYSRPPISSPPSARKVAPSKREKPAVPAKKSKPASSFHRPNNFIERMRSAKKQNRYDPYSRSSNGKKNDAVEIEERELTAEEELELIKKRQREREVQEAEDRYLEREALRKLGKLVDEEAKAVEEKEKEKEQEEVELKMKEKEVVANNVLPRIDESKDEEMALVPVKNGITKKSESSIAKEKEKENRAPEPSKTFPSLFATSSTALTTTGSTTTTTTPSSSSSSSSSSPPSFLFGGATNPTPLAESTAANINPPQSWSFNSDSDKENISTPPPPPVMSHAELPPVSQPVVPPPAMAGSLFSNPTPVLAPPASAPALAPAQTFGLGQGGKDNAVGRQRSAAEKWKPAKSSGLRESVGVDDDVGANVKIDIRAFVAEIPVDKLSFAGVWPAPREVGSRGVREAVGKMWNAGSSAEWGFGVLFEIKV